MKELDRITVDPEVCLGQPTIRGMRITVSIILKQIAAGMTNKENLQAYLELTEEDIASITQVRSVAFLRESQIAPDKRSCQCLTLPFSQI